MANVQEMITGRRWKWVSRIVTAEAPGRKIIPPCSSTQPASCYHVWAAQIPWAIRESSKIQGSSEIESNWAGQPEKTGSRARWNAYRLEHSFGARTKIAQYEVNLSSFKGLCLLTTTFYVFNWYNQIFFLNKDTPHKLVFPSFQLHWLNWILGIFIRLTSGRMVEWIQQLWQCWKKSMNGTGGSFKHSLWSPDTEWKKRHRNENIWGVLAKSRYSCIYNSLRCHIKFF